MTAAVFTSTLATTHLLEVGNINVYL